MNGMPGQFDPAFSEPGAKDLSPAHLEALRPYVVNLTLGEFSDDGIMHTTGDDVDAIFDVHLPPSSTGRNETARPARCRWSSGRTAGWFRSGLD